MKKALIILSIIISGVYLTQAINLNLSSGSKLDSNNWQNINNITSKINLNSNNLNISGDLVSSLKICSGEDCLGKCNTGYIWDTHTNGCLIIASTPETSGLSCKDLYDNKNVRTDGVYYVKPTGYTGNAFQVYCDMTTDGGGWTLVGVFKTGVTTDYYSTSTECFANDPNTPQKCHITKGTYGLFDWDTIRYRHLDSSGDYITLIGNTINDNKWNLVNNTSSTVSSGFSTYKIVEKGSVDYICSVPTSTVYKNRGGGNGLIQIACSNPSGNRQTNYGMDIAHDNVYAGMHLTSPSNWFMKIWIR